MFKSRSCIYEYRHELLQSVSENNLIYWPINKAWIISDFDIDENVYNFETLVYETETHKTSNLS